MKKNLIISLLTLTMLTQFLAGCVSVKAYQKMYLNDKDMVLHDRKCELYELNAISYREGAAGANGGKSGGGCGCN